MNSEPHPPKPEPHPAPLPAPTPLPEPSPDPPPTNPIPPEVPGSTRSASRTYATTMRLGYMTVGHNPGLEELVEKLTGQQQDLPTAALAQIVLPIDRWRDLKRSTRGTLLATGNRRN